MLYGAEDIALRRRFIDTGDAPAERKRMEHRKLDSLLGFTETSDCRRQVLLSYFGDDGQACGNCDACLEPPETFDGSISAQKLLSAIYRTGERFGQAYVISVLLGEDDERIRNFGHDQLPTFGVGKEHNRNQWRSLIRQLVARGLITVDIMGHGGMAISQSGRMFLKEKQPLPLRMPKKSESAKKAARTQIQIELSDADQNLFDRLREKRLELAKEQNVPPYVIFHDKTLAEMAAQRPTTTENMAQISGVGKSKLTKYAADFLEVINNNDSENLAKSA